MGAAPDQTSQFYVNDYADILSEDAERKIVNIGDDLCDETTAQVVVLTVESLDGEDIAEYSVEVFREWKIGDKEKENGVLIVFSLNDREMWITTGYGIEGTLTDARVGQIRDTYAMPYYKNDEFEKGTLELYCAIVNYIRTEEYGLDPLTGYEEMDIEMGLTEEPPFGAFLILLIPVGLIVFLLIHHKIKYKRLLAYDKKHGTNLAEEYRETATDIGRLLLYTFIFSGNGRGGRGGRGGHGGFGGGGFGGGGFRGGGGSTGGGGAGGKF